MKPIQISINPLAEFSEASDTRKERIRAEALDPNPIKIAYYQMARARIKSSIASGGDITNVNNAITDLKSRKPENTRQKSDYTCSVEALEKFKTMVLPQKLINNQIEIISTTSKGIHLYGLDITVAPNLIFKINIDGTNHVGACKIHLSKHKVFSTKQSKLVATVLYQFVSDHVADECDFVDPDLCFCVDPFAGTTINADGRISVMMRYIETVCDEIRKVKTSFFIYGRYFS